MYDIKLVELRDVKAREKTDISHSICWLKYINSDVVGLSLLSFKMGYLHMRKNNFAINIISSYLLDQSHFKLVLSQTS